MDILHLEFLAQKNRRRLEHHLHDPFFHSWGVLSPERFEKGYLSLKSRLSDSLRVLSLVDMHLITEYLLFHENAPGWIEPWLKEHVDLMAYLPETGWPRVLSGHWQTVPVILVRDYPYLRYFLVGMMRGREDQPLMPAWAGDVLDETSMAAVSNAASASKRNLNSPKGFRLYCYPLIAGDGGVQIEGTSLGLPLMLGFLKVLRGESMAEGVLATGAVDENGLVSKAGHLQQKINYAGMKGFKVLLYPSQNSAPAVPEGMDALPVSRLEDAWMFSTLYAPKCSRDLALFAGILEDPLKFVNNCDCVPCEWVEWAHSNEKTSSVLKAIRESSELFENLTRKFEKCLNRRPLEKAETISNLFKSEDLEGLAETAPLATFRWLTLSIALANHQGKVLDAVNWAKHAGALLDRVRSYDLNECATYHNHRFVTQHNLYQFDPALPDELQQTLRHLEKRYKLSNENGYKADVTLGCLYGSISQNYGFCGPQYFEDAEQYSRLSRQAFVGETLPEHREDSLRQFNYLTYAALDAGHFKMAEEALIRYLGIEEWREVWPILPRFSPWRHALLARFFADTEDMEKAKRYLIWALDERRRLVRQEHPYQLWLFNLGRIAQCLGEEGSSAELYSESLDLCLSELFGPTVHVMALLPLSGLWKLCALSKIDIKKMENMVRKAAGILNPVHFSMLLNEKDFEKIIETTWDRPEMLFPFAYR